MFKKLYISLLLVGLLFVNSPAIAATTLWQYYNAQGQSLPSLEDRSVIAAQLGLFDYAGTAEDNTELLYRLENPPPALFPQEEGALGFSAVTGYQKTLRASMDSTQSYIPASSLSLSDGTTIDIDDLDGEVYLTIEPGKARQEIVRCTAITTSTANFTSCTRGLAFKGTSVTSVAANRFSHNAGSTIVISNVHYTFKNLVDGATTNDQTIAGKVEFTTSTIWIGDDTTDVNKTVYANNGDAYLPFVRYNEDISKWQFSDDGITTINLVTSTGSGLSASTTAGIGITDSEIYIKASSTLGYTFDTDGKLFRAVSSTTGIEADSDGLKLNSSTIKTLVLDPYASTTPTASKIPIAGVSSTLANGWIPQPLKYTGFNAGETIDGTSNPVVVYQKSSDGELYKADGSVGDEAVNNVVGFVTNSTIDGNSADLVTEGILDFGSITKTTTVSSYSDQQFSTGSFSAGGTTIDATTKWESIAFKVGEGTGNIKTIDFISGGGTGSPTMQARLYATDSSNKPTGAALATSVTLDVSGAGYTTKTFTFTTPYEVTAGQILAVVFVPVVATVTDYTVLNRTIGNGQLYRFDRAGTFDNTAVNYYTSSNSGSTWASNEGNGSPYFSVNSTEKQAIFGDDLYLSTSGAITHLVPSTEAIVKVGTLAGTTKLDVDFGNKQYLIGTYGASGNVTVYHVPPKTRTIIISDASAEQITVLKKFGPTTFNGSSLDATWTGNSVYINQAVDSVNFYSY